MFKNRSNQSTPHPPALALLLQDGWLGATNRQTLASFSDLLPNQHLLYYLILIAIISLLRLSLATVDVG